MTTRGLFCISGVRTYQDAENLEDVTEEIGTMRRALTALGLTELFPFAATERSHYDLEDELSEWAKTPGEADRPDDETLLIYCTGHGVVFDTRFRLLLSDGHRYAPDSLLTVLPGRKSLRQVVLILDVCFSEPGIDEAQLEMRRPNTESSKMEFWGIGSSRRLETAAQRTFAEAFADALERNSRPSWSISHFEPGAIASEVNTALGPGQTVWLAEGHSANVCRVLPNPRHQPPVPPVNLPLTDDWAAQARGVSAANQPGFFFTGREYELRALREHIDGKDAESTLVVTGAPGSGKSALLGHLVLSAVGLDALPAEVRLRWPVLSTRVIACRGSQTSILRGLARRLGLTGHEFDDVLLALRELPGRTAVVLDQLVDTGDDSWDDVLAALADVPGVRLVLGLPTRSGIRVHAAHRTIDLDGLGERTGADVREYLALRLGLAHSNATGSKMRRLASTAASWGLSFEVAVAWADAYTDALARGLRASEADSRAERAAAGAARRACRTVLNSYLGARAGVVVDALCGLCSYDESVALPAREWAAAASDPSGAQVSPEEVSVAAARLGPFVECVPGTGGLKRWRPRFPSRVSADTPPPEHFLARLPQVSAPSQVEWDAVDPSVQTLVTFAASLETQHGRMLDDPDFLLGAPPGLVSAAVRRLRNNAPDRTRRSLVARAVPPNGTPADRALLLGIAARRYGIKPVANSLGTTRYRPAHDIGWVQPDRPRNARLTRLSIASPGAIAVTVDDGDVLDFWSLADGKPTRSPVQVPDVPRAVTVATVGGDALALVTTWQGEIWSVACLGDDQLMRRPELVPPGVGGTRSRELLVAMHPCGQVVVGLGTEVWVTDVTSGRRVRQVSGLGSDLHTILTTGPVDTPIAWLVSNTGRIRRLWLSTARRLDVAQFPTPRTPLVAAASPDGARVLVVDVGGDLHLRSSSRDGDLLGGDCPPDIRAAAVDDRFAVVAGGPAGGRGWLEAYDLIGSAPPTRVPLDEAPIGVALPETGQILVARPSGLLTLALRPPCLGARTAGPSASRNQGGSHERAQGPSSDDGSGHK